MRQHKGSITIFALLAMLLVMTTLFTFLELGRFHQIKGIAKLQTEAALESVFADYSSYLWNNYHLLGCDQTKVNSQIQKMGNSRQNLLTGRSNLFLFQVEDVDLEEYTLLTDGNGTAYIQAAAAYMEKHILYEAAKEIFNQYEAVKNIMETSSPDTSKIDTALKELEAEKERLEREKMQQKNQTRVYEQMEEKSSVGNSKTQENTENFLVEIQKLQKTGILELVLEDTSSISESNISLSESVSNRTLSQGNQKLAEINWIDQIWLQQYLLSEMSYFGEKKEGHAMSYELEYLIGGKEYDYANLKAAVTELLFIREAANFLYLMSDTKKVEEASIMAGALAGISGSPLLVETVKAGILAAWSFGESVLDVRALLQNKKVPLIKNESLWTLELENITDISKGYLTAKEGDWGLSYKDYLGILLLFQPGQQNAMRSMDLQEVTLQSMYGNKEILMDHFMTRAEVKVTYVYHPVFFDVTDISNMWNYEIFTVQEFGYY